MGEWIGLGLTALAVVIIPLLVMIVRGFVRWSRIESKVDTMGMDLKEIHDEIKDDRKATNERLTYLERTLWRRERNAVRD